MKRIPLAVVVLACAGPAPPEIVRVGDESYVARASDLPGVENEERLRHALHDAAEAHCTARGLRFALDALTSTPSGPRGEPGVSAALAFRCVAPR